MADKVGFCTLNFTFSVLHYPHFWVYVVYWISTTASSIYLVICHCILLIIQVLIFVTNSQSARADGLRLVYFTSFNKHLLHLVIIMYSMHYMLRRARLEKRSSVKWQGMV